MDSRSEQSFATFCHVLGRLMRQKKAVPALSPKLFDVVELAAAGTGASVATGSVGTVVDELDGETYLVEFCDAAGRAVAVEPIAARDLIVHE